MVCKGLRHEEDCSKTCEKSAAFYEQNVDCGMADSYFGRYGRRKQANPKRNQLDETPLEADPRDEGRILASNDITVTSSSTCHDINNHNNDTMIPDSETATMETIRDDDPASAILEVKEMSPVDKDVENSRSDEVRTPSSLTPNSPEASDKEAKVNGNHDDDFVVTEDEKIQELMNRSDTAVIYPEPVSDQEDGNAMTEGEDVGEFEDDVVKCPHCEVMFGGVEELKEHWHSNHSTLTSKHSCSQCNIHFPSKNQLDKHLTLHSPSTQLCKICKKTFANVYRLQRHMISHEESSELRKFKCPECHKAFKFKHHLKEHIRIHSGEKPFECQNCGKRFSHSGSYSSHMTSKKCWVVNMKMRNTGGSPRIEKTDGLSHTLIPTTMENGLDMNLVAASMIYNSSIPPQQFLHFDHSSPFLAQNHFMPPIPFTTAMSNSLMSGLPIMAGFGCLPPGSANGETKITGSKSECAALLKCKEECKSPAMSKENTPVREITDENMNKETAKELNRTVKSNDSLNTLNKVLEFVSASENQIVKEEESKESANLKAANGIENESRTLTALASAATQQLQKLMKETKCDNPIDIKMEACREMNNINLTCRFCHDSFSSPISLHQHERYLCKFNKDIQRPESEVAYNLNANSPVASKSADDSFDDYENERKVRVRSMITDEQVQVLKSFYQSNQRPNKFELESLARQIGFPKRVVQVWFQNMRARDRRKGRVIRDVKPDHSPSSNTSSGYIPIVPQVSKPSAANKFYATTTSPTMNGHALNVYSSTASPQRACEANSEAEQPLDLTMKLPQAHTSKPFSSRPEPNDSDEILNLSMHKKETTSCSPTPATMAETALHPSKEDRNIVQSVTSACVPLVVPIITSTPSLAMSIPLHINTTPAHSRPYASFSSMNQPAFSHQSPPQAHFFANSRPIYDASISSSPGLISGELVSPRPSSLDSSFNSLDSHNDSSSVIYGLSAKTKRSRKKSWMQVEAEEMFDESLDEDGDSPSRKKRRSWKQHRVDMAEGLYACDQCDKMFNKQSSLARHKYEHSGQRPFPCDICTKAFKHKHHLTEHKRLHSGEKPFQCQKCGKRFSHSGSYSQHMNHRYKYCKPLMGEGSENGDIEMETETMDSDASP